MIHGFARPLAAHVAASARGLFLLVVVGWAAVGAGESPPPGTRADVDVAPPPPGLEERMERLAGAINMTGAKALQNVEAVQDVLTRAADSGALQTIDDSLQTSSAIILDRSLQGRKGELGALRQWQQQAAKRLVDGLGEQGAQDELARLARRYPWAQRVQEALIGRGERALREGQYDWAARAFETAALHADDPAVLAQARAGQWLAIGLGFGAEAMEQTMVQIPDGEAMAWPGEGGTAGQAKAFVRRLTAGNPPAQVPLPCEPTRRLLLPAPLAAPAPFTPDGPDTRCLGPWALSRVECAGGQWLLFGARGLACYDAATMALRWHLAPAGASDSSAEESSDDNARARHARRPVAGGAARSSPVAERMVYALLPGPQGRCDLATLDAITGRLLWTTQARPEWTSLKILGEPTVDQDRLWILAADENLQGPCVVSLMCLAADDARPIWRQRLGTLSREGRPTARARFACGTTLYQGSVYVSTNLGILARCEARAGTVEWLRTYYAPPPNQEARSRDHREGSVPLAAGERVFFVPRDHGGVIALDRQTGQLAWENPLVPSDQVVGLVGQALIVRDANELAALDVASGKNIWRRPADSAGQGPALIVGANVLAADGNKLLRLAAQTGQVVEESAAPRAPGAEHLLAPDGTLVEVREDPVLERALAPDIGAAPGPLHPPFVKRWALPCRQPLLVVPPAGPDLGQRVGVFSEGRFYCVALRPACRLAWQMRLTQPLDSAGFHGPVVVLAAGDELTGVDKETGAVRWRKTLPFAPDLIVGDDRLLLAGCSSGPCPVTALSAETGATIWHHPFGHDPRFSGDRLQRITLSSPPGVPAVVWLYWGKALLAPDTRRPAEATVDPASGALRDMRAFGPLETDWPADISFGDEAHTRLTGNRDTPRPSRGPFRPDAFAYVGKEAIARFALREGGADLAPGWNPKAEGWWGGQYLTPAGAYVKRPGQLAFFDAQAKREILFDLPRTPDRAPASAIADFREGSGDTLTVVSAAPGSFRPWGFGAIVKTGLHDDAGNGNVTLTAFDPGGAQIGIYCRRLPEAGLNPIATLHNWGASEAYRRQHMAMKGISSLGWTKYDIFLYGASGKGTVTINGGRPQEHQGTDFSNPLHRTTFIRGVNYVKVEGVTGDEFLLCYEWDCSGIQVVDASGGAGPRRSLAVRWTTSGPALRPDEKIGVEVAAGNWYTINKHFALLGGYQADKGKGVIGFVDVFDRKSGKVLGSHALASTQPAPPPAPYDCQAKLLDEALLVTDVNGFYVFGSAP